MTNRERAEAVAKAYWRMDNSSLIDIVQAAIGQAASDEREACAKTLLSMPGADGDGDGPEGDFGAAVRDCARAIRARVNS